MNASEDPGIPMGEIYPARLISEQDRVEGFIDGLNAVLKMYCQKPSTFVQGATFLCSPDLKNNPDWIAQAAHSLREVGYLFSGPPHRKWSKTLLAILAPYLKKIYICIPVNRAEKTKKNNTIILRGGKINSSIGSAYRVYASIRWYFSPLLWEHRRRKSNIKTVEKDGDRARQ